MGEIRFDGKARFSWELTSEWEYELRQRARLSGTSLMHVIRTEMQRQLNSGAKPPNPPQLLYVTVDTKSVQVRR